MDKYTKTKEYLKNNQATWLITGVAGFIGSNLLEALLGLNQKVVGLDNFATGFQHNIDHALANSSKTTTRNFRFIRGDICDLETCHKACIGVDYVLHQAALGSVPRSVENPINTNRNNIDGFLNMLVAGRDADVKRFVYAASSSTYGDHPDLPKIEDKIGRPLSPYAVTKYVNELYADVFARTYSFNTIGLRYFNVFGKYQDPKGAYAAVIPKWVYAILNNGPVYINGDGETSRDFCYIDNAIQMNMLSALSNDKAAVNQVYNVAVGEQTSLNQLFFMILEKLRNIDSTVKNINPVYRDFRTGDVRHSRADISKASNLLSYVPEYDIDQGLSQAIAWYFDDLKS